VFPDSWFLAAFTAWGVSFTWLEIVAVIVSLAMVWCQMRVSHWSWPLAIIAAVLYAALFAQFKLYGEASLQLFFIAVSLWGWWLWFKKPTASSATTSPRVQEMTRQQMAAYAVVAAIAVGTCGAFLRSLTDSDVVWFDAVPTGLSVVAQVMLGRKYLENWLAWLVVNVLSTALFAYKALYLTALLYAVFAVLSVMGWRSWRLLLNK
jgi:nicotinamide mononucleotide transporter